jgi:hypothetical protein
MAVKESIAEYLQKKKDESEKQQNSINWDARRQRWQKAIGTLYKSIEKWLRDAIDQNIVAVNYIDTTIEEEYIGQYPIRILRLDVGAERVVFEPKGTLIMGASGRVDVTGKEGTIRLVLIDDEWYITARDIPRQQWPLIKETFDDLLRQLLG